VEHVLIRKLEHLAGTKGAPRLGFAVEARDRKGPAHKHGAYSDDVVWVQLHGGLFVAKARVKICWIGEYSRIEEIRRRTSGTPLHDMDSFWAGRPRVGYAAVAELERETWVPPFWAGPRTYGYEWVVLESDEKRSSWLEKSQPPRGGEGWRGEFGAWLESR
jgi:hypothetical protein